LAPKWTLWATIFFVLGGTLLTVSALINPGHYALFGLGKAHAKIAQAAAIALNLGMAMTIPALLRLPPRWPVARAGVLFLAVGPMTLFLLCRMIAIHDSLFPSLAFWEWIASATVFSFLAVVFFIGKIR
jgi:hypothetical protein